MFWNCTHMCVQFIVAGGDGEKANTTPDGDYVESTPPPARTHSLSTAIHSVGSYADEDYSDVRYDLYALSVRHGFCYCII